VRKRTEYIIVLAVVAAIVAAALVLLAHRPPMPASWSKLRAGMTQKEVESLVGINEEVGSWDRAVVLEHTAPMLGADGMWMLGLEYDGLAIPRGSNARLIGATATYFHRFRLLSSRPRKLLSCTVLKGKGFVRISHRVGRGWPQAGRGEHTDYFCELV